MTWYWSLGLVAAASLLVVLGTGLQTGTEQAMKRTGGPGIIGLELARTTDAVQSIIRSWGASGVAAARAGLYYDFILIVGYAGFISIVLATASHTLGIKTWWWMATVSNFLAWFALLTGLCDVLENLSLLVLLRRTEKLAAAAQPWARLAWAFAMAKFVALAFLIGWVLLIEVPVVVTPQARVT
jgi:hypothetical protein